jgi:hypothetical protein
MTHRNALLTIGVLFLISVLCRIPFLTRPLDGEHDMLTLHSLLYLSIWNSVGLQASRYSLRMTYENPADKFVRGTFHSGMFDSKGNFYYVSFPPFAWLLAFSLLKVFHLPVHPIWLKLINLAVLFPATLALYSVLERASGVEDRSIARKVALLGVALFLFNRAVLLSLGNLFSPHELVVPIWIISVYFYCAAQDRSDRERMNLALFGVMTFLACYCDWQGWAAAATFFLWSLVRRVRRPVDYRLAGLSVISVVLAGVLIFVEYSSIDGPQAFLGALASRFLRRAGISGSSEAGLTLWNPDTYFYIYYRYREQYTPLLLLLGALISMYFLVPRLSRSLRWTSEVQRALFLFGLPVVIDHILLANHTAIHNFATLKTAPFLVVTVVVLMGGLVRHPWGEGNDSVRFPVLMRCTLAVAVVCLVATKRYLNERNDLNPAYSRLGMTIRQQSNPKQVIFLLGGESVSGNRLRYMSNLIYFAGRNVQAVDREEEARQFLERHEETEGVLFAADLDGNLTAPPTIIRTNPQ